MERPIGRTKANAWGSTNAIPKFLGAATGNDPVSEVWSGAHPDGPMLLVGGQTFAEYIGGDSKRTLDGDLLYASGPALSYLAKTIVPVQTLGPQVHLMRGIAREGYPCKGALGIERAGTCRVYRDTNYKPETIYMFTEFSTLVGFRVSRKARQLLAGLEGGLVGRLRHRPKLSAVHEGLRSLATWPFGEDSPVTSERVKEFMAACRSCLASGISPSPRTDEPVSVLGEKHPGDPGIIVVSLMKLVSLRLDEAIHILPYQIHVYQSGLDTEIMASSDSAVRTGPVGKYVDSAQLAEIARSSALPPVRAASEHPLATMDRFLVPIQEFKLSMTTLTSGKYASRVDEVVAPGEGSHIIIATSGSVSLYTSEEQNGDSTELSRGQAVFVSAAERRVWAYGTSSFMQVVAP